MMHDYLVLSRSVLRRVKSLFEKDDKGQTTAGTLWASPYYSEFITEQIVRLRYGKVAGKLVLQQLYS
jgi:hypothetical protein